ncbi:glycosyltransferase [Anoxybacillus sp. FSL W8-1294]|uniref:glycosyltransferase n=1 Tax=Anoxybacillus sp. FSL W8-1294 TaxID=2954655 RepID=UPI0030D2DC65
METITIVVVAFNRPDSLKRNLKALLKADYPGKVRLVISIDKGNNKHVLDIANSFDWKYGEKIVIYQKENIGLRRHILKCGDLTNQYGNIILLEDDIYVSPNFYNFALQALEFYQDHKEIAGISLYSPRFNETASLPFEPLQSNYDVFFSQLPSSWGQLWTASQWNDFRNWYNNESNLKIKPDDYNLPDNVKKWPESSWKKYFIKYMVDNQKFFVYPYISLTTNFGDIGTHFWRKNNAFQVPLSYNIKKEFKFCRLDETNVRYDVFNENIGIIEIFDKEIRNNITVDLYGKKSEKAYKKYLLTTKKLNYHIIKQYDLTMKPIEDNILQNIPGNSIFLYDTTKIVKNRYTSTTINIEEYFYGHLNPTLLAKLLFNKQLFLSILKRILKRGLK